MRALNIVLGLLEGPPASGPLFWVNLSVSFLPRLDFRRKLLPLFLHCGVANQFIIGQPLVYNLAQYRVEPTGIVQFPQVVSECLFVKLAAKVVGLHADIGSMNTALQEAPEVLKCICVNAAINIATAWSMTLWA